MAKRIIALVLILLTAFPFAACSDENTFTFEEIIERSEADFIDGKLETVAYPDGSREYCYDGFKMIVLNTHLRNVDVYFTPSSMSFYDVYQR